MLGHVKNVERKMVDDQMDCESDMEVLPPESIVGTTVDDQESPGSPYCSFTSSTSEWHSAMALDQPALGVGSSVVLDQTIRKAIFFVETFVEGFEKKIFEYFEESKPGSKTRKTGKVLDRAGVIVNVLVPPGQDKLGLSQLIESAGLFFAKKHKKAAKNVSALAISFGDKVREILIEAGLEIFQKFEEQFTKVVDVDRSSWERGVEKLAIDAKSRAINYILFGNKEQGSSIDLITKGVILGESKSDTIAKQIFHKTASFFKKKEYVERHSKLKQFQFGYRVRDTQGNEIWVTSELYKNIGIKKTEDSTTVFYQLNAHDCAEKYGYRGSFLWESKEYLEARGEYVLVDRPQEEYTYVLSNEKKEELADSILKRINGKDPVKRKDMEELYDKIRNLQICREKEDSNTFFFNLSSLPMHFVKRKTKLKELNEKLHGESQEKKMSRMVLISGRSGTGKSELARSYLYDKESGNSIWTKIVWVDVETRSTLLDSFRGIAKALGIATERIRGMRAVDDMIGAKKQNATQEREAESIVKDIYKKFWDVKSLFVFDNANEYKEIEKFLPSNFPDLFFNKKKPYVLITSRNKDWKEEIEKVELDNGFSPAEAMMFFEGFLGIRDKSQMHSLIDLIEALGYLPFALKQAAAYIKQGNVSISEYLIQYNKAIREKLPEPLEALGITRELFATLKLNLGKVREKTDVGCQLPEVLNLMVHLDSNRINIEEIFLQRTEEKRKQQVLHTLDWLHKFSLIELKEQQSIARIHAAVRNAVIVEEEQIGKEEECLREMMTSCSITNVGHIKSVWSHVSKYSNLVNEFIDSIYDESNILHLLAKDCNKEVIELILQKADTKKLSKVIDAVDAKGVTALKYAIISNQLDVVKCLVEHGANVNLPDKDGMSPLCVAAEQGSLDIVKYLIEEANVSLLDEDNASSLHYAIVEEELGIIQYLVEHGANVNLPDKDGMSPLGIAVEQRSLGVIQYLVEHGANVNLPDKDGVSPLGYAVGVQGLGIVKYLVEHGADVNLLGVDAKSVYSRFLEENLDWMKEREGPPFSDQDAKREILGSVCFEVRDPARLFTGRERELEELHRMLQHNQGGLSVISQIKSVSGLGGVGKTQLVRKYVQKYAKVYDENIVWINAETEATLGQSFFDLARDNRLGICSIDRDKSARPIKSIVKEIYSFFAKRKSLFIFDNVDNIQHLKEFLPLSVLRSSDERPYILITSRNQQWEDSMSCLRLEGLSLKDAVTFVKSGLGIEDELQNEGIEDLVIDLQFFPLAIQQAISYIRYHDVTGKLSIVDYLVQYHEKKKDLLDSTIFQDIDSEYARTVFTTWDITFDKIKNNKECGDLALEILCIMAYFGSENINRRMFVGLAGRDESKLKSAVRLLVSYSIISGQEEQSILSVHKLVQEVVMIKLADKHRNKEVMKRAVRLMNDICSSSESSSSTESFLLHQKALLSHIDSWIVKNPQDRSEMLQDSLALLLPLLGNEYFKIYALEEAVECFKRVLEIEEAFDDKDIVKVIEVTMDLGRVYKALEEYAGQERILSQIEHDVRNIYKPESSEAGKLGEFLIELGEVRQVLGGFDKRNIKNLLEEGYSVLEKVYSEEHKSDYYELGEVLMSLSKACEVLDDYDKQAKSLDKALVIFSECYGEDSFEVAEVQVEIAKVCVNLKKYCEARNHIQEAIGSLSFYPSDNDHVYKLSCSISEFNNLFGLDSDGIAKVEENGIEDMVLKLKKDSLAEACGLVVLSKVCSYNSDLRFYYIQEAIEIFEKHYQEGDYMLAKELINLADAYGDIDRPLEQEKVIQERILPVLLCEVSRNLSYTIARARLSLAKSWALLGKYEEQLKLLIEEVLPFFIGKYGNKHFEVAEIQLSIAIAYGRLEKDYAKQVNLIEETVLPVFKELHQSSRIVNALVTLGEAYGHLNNYEKRADCLQNALRCWRLFSSSRSVPLYDSDVLSVKIIVSLSETCGILKQYDKQAGLLVEALGILRNHHSPSNKEIVKVRVMMARAYGNLNRYDQAIDVLHDSLPILNGKSVNDTKLGRSDRVIKFLVDHYLDQQTSLQRSEARKRTLDSSSPEHSLGKKIRKERSLGVSCIDSLDDEFENDDTMEKLKNTKEFYDQLLKFSERVSGREVVDIEESLFTRIENIDLNLIDPEISDIVREMRGNIRKKDGVKNVMRRSGVAEKIGKVAESANLAFTTFLLSKHPVNGDGRLEVDGAKQMSLEPQSYLSNASIQSHSKDKVSTCLSDVGVTKLGNTLSK